MVEIHQCAVEHVLSSGSGTGSRGLDRRMPWDQGCLLQVGDVRIKLRHVAHAWGRNKRGYLPQKLQVITTHCYLEVVTAASGIMLQSIQPCKAGRENHFKDNYELENRVACRNTNVLPYSYVRFY